jgi:hypothetical protein
MTAAYQRLRSRREEGKKQNQASQHKPVPCVGVRTEKSTTMMAGGGRVI